MSSTIKKRPAAKRRTATEKQAALIRKIDERIESLAGLGQDMVDAIGTDAGATLKVLECLCDCLDSIRRGSSENAAILGLLYDARCHVQRVSGTVIRQLCQAEEAFGHETLREAP